MKNNDCKRSELIEVSLKERDEVISFRNKEKAVKVDQTENEEKRSLNLTIQMGDEFGVAELLEKGVDVDQSDEQGWTPLCTAAYKGDEAVVAQLLEKGANVNQVSKTGWTPLYMAARKGYEGVVVQLLEKGASVNQAEKSGWTPLMVAVTKGHEAVVAQLLKKGADVDQANANGATPLFIAAQKGNEAVVAQLLEKGANVNQAKKDGWTSLMIAAQKNHETVVAQLLEKGANVNQADAQGQTPLMIVAENGHQGVAVQLLEKGAKMNQANANGETPLYIAAHNGYEGMVAQLLERGADVNQAKKDGWMPLMIAAGSGYQGVVTQLLEKGANVNQADKDGWTSLILAALRGYQAVVAQLLENGADVNQASVNGATPLYVAAQKGNEAVVTQLLKKGANVNQADEDGWTSLMLAALNGYQAVVEQLLENGADVNQASMNGVTPLAIATMRSHFKIVVMLLKAGVKIENEQKKYIALLYPHLEEWLQWGEYEICLMLSDYRLNQEPGVRIEERVIAYYAQGKLDKAFEYLEMLKKRNRQEDRAFIAYSSGYLKMEQGEFDLAIKYYEEALRKNKNSDDVCYDRMLAELYKTGNPEAVLKRLEELPSPGIFQNKAAVVYSYYVKGFIYHQCLQHEKALVCFNEVLKRNKKNIFALAKRGFLLLCQGEREDGFKDLDAALAINPYYSGALARKGYGLALEEAFEEAEGYFKRSLEVNPSHFETLLLKGASLILQNFPKVAKECIERTFAVSVSRSLLIAQHMPQEVKEKIIDYAFEYSLKDKRKLKEVLLVLLRLSIFSEKTQEKVEFYLMKAYSEEELNVLLRAVSENSPLYAVLCRAVLNNTKKYQIEKEQREAYFETKRKELYYQLMQLTDENSLTIQKEAIQKENELYAPCCQLSMVLFRDRDLKKEVQSCLAPYAGEIEEKAGQTVYGTHVVKQCGEVHFKYHDNTNPCYPVIEYMIGTLYSLLAGTSYGTSPTEIVKLHYKGYERVLVASQIIRGINLFDFLTHYVERESQLIQQFDSHSFSTMIITSLLSNPVDGKADNYMVQFFKNENEEEKFKVLGFDNDLAFGEPVVKIHRGKRAGQHFVEVRNVFYFFPQMNSSIDSTLCKRLVDVSPELLMLEFIRSLQKQDEYYKQLLKEGVLTEKEAEALQLPICFPREETLGIMYKRLRAIQKCLKENNQLSHMQLFYAIYPEMARYYQEIAIKNEAKPNAILRNIAELYAASAPTLEEAAFILEQKSVVTMSRLAIKTMEKGEYAKPRYSLLKGIEKFVELIQFSGISLERQRQILREIKSLSGIEQLTLRNCAGLDDKLLQVFLEDLLALKKLDLVNCYQIKAESIAMVSPKGRVIEIKITQEKSKKQASTPQFEQFLAQLGKSEKASRKRKREFEGDSHQNISFGPS